jgi:predicted dehydrogenase
MFKVGIIGCGGIGMAHARSWSAIHDVEISAVVDLNPEKAIAAAELFQCPYYTNIEELPNNLDAVSVVTPPGAHYPVVKAMLERSINVFCEKPLTMDVAQGEELNSLAASQGKVLAVGFKMRYEPIFNVAKEYLSQLGALRSIVTTKIQQFNPRPEGAWVTRVGAMYELSIHDFDLLSFITGLKPEKVISARLEHRRGWEKEDAFSAMVEYEQGVTAMLQGMYCDETTFCFRDLTITLLGEHGYMRIERPDRIVLHTNDFRVIEVNPAEKSAFVLELEHFKNAVEEKCTNTLKASDAVMMTKMIEEIRAFTA